MQFNSTFYWVAVALILVVSTARVTRLLVHDKFPPIKWLRDRYEARFEDSGWVYLTMCHYCMAPWVTVLAFITAYYSGIFTNRPAVAWFEPAWWLIAGGLAVSYLSAILVSRDADDEAV